MSAVKEETKVSIATEALLRKATQLESTDGTAAGPISGGDFGGAGQASLSIEQVTQFIELMQAEQIMLGEARTVTSSAAKWNESILDFDSRITRGGIEGKRLDDTTPGQERAKPSSGLVEISTVLLRAEIPVSDEAFEDNVGGPQGLASALERLIADRFGYDVEDLMVNAGRDDLVDTYYDLLPDGGWLAQAKADGNSVDGSTMGEDYQEIFRTLLNKMPDRFKRGQPDHRFYIPKRAEEKYRDILAARGTALGDLMLTGRNSLTYQGIEVRGVPSFAIRSNKSYVLLCNRNNLYAGYHRAMKFETFRDPREGATSFIVTARVDAKVAVPDAVAVAYDVDCAI